MHKHCTHTFVRHHLSGLEVHLGTSGVAYLFDTIAHLVTAVLATAQAQTLVEGLLRTAAICHALMLLVHQGINEQMNGSFMRTLHKLVHV